MKELWLCGRVVLDTWEFQGIFETKELAVKACKDVNWFVASVKLNKEIKVDTKRFPKSYYPLA